MSDLQPLYAFCISSKRYALFNLDEKGAPVIRKASAHGLGHLQSPYDDGQFCNPSPPPKYKLDKIGVVGWQHDFWFKIISAAIEGHSEQVDLSFHANLNAPAMSRYAATTPSILRWFKRYNGNLAYRDQVKPFGFLSALTIDPIATLANEKHEIKLSKKGVKRPVAPYNRDPFKAAQNAFDRETGYSIQPHELKTYAAALAQYHLSPERKFQNGDYLDFGRTERRHVVVRNIVHIGKEANKWEEQFYLGAYEDEQIEYGVSQTKDWNARVRHLCEKVGERAVAKHFGSVEKPFARRSSLASTA